VNVSKRILVWSAAAVLLASSARTAMAAPGIADPAGAGPDGAEEVVANDNRRPAGIATEGNLVVRLRAARGVWRPEGAAGPVLSIEAFGVDGGALSVPGPLLRVREGTMLAVSIRNDLAAPLRVNGMCARDGAPCAAFEVAPGATHDVRFIAGRPGTYHYWATTLGAPMPFRELAGAFVVDPAGPIPPDRVLVITEWTNLTLAQLQQIITADDPTRLFAELDPKLTFVINGLSWPATERLTYRRGETVRWRVINVSSQAHPMHLHGFYFTVTHLGDGRTDQPVAGGAGRRQVTQILSSGATMAMEWQPEREGNWLFHCHIMGHVSLDRRLGPAATTPDPHAAHRAHAGHAAQRSASHDRAAHAGHDGAALGMAGMVLGITVLPAMGDARPADEAIASTVTPRRRITMSIAPVAGQPAGRLTTRITLTEAGATAPMPPARSAGPVLVLRRDEPVEIVVVNSLDEPTSIHWHGLELESFYDGVHGWSGAGPRVAPMIAPGASFVVRLTPPRAGTFIYHTHLHDYRQLSSGLYGAIVVTEPGETFDPRTDHVVVLGRQHVSQLTSLLEDAETAVVNGEHAPQLTWRAGTRNRIRLVNITPDDLLRVSLVARDTPVSWRPLSKDGAPVPATETQVVPAILRIAVGETYDFEYEAPPVPVTLWLEVRTSSGKWQSQARVVVR
jgi:manganese oxidase